MRNMLMFYPMQEQLDAFIPYEFVNFGLNLMIKLFLLYSFSSYTTGKRLFRSLDIYIISRYSDP